MPPRKATSLPIDGESDSDWEYEYHETETEDFYITLDLSSHTRQFAQGIKLSSTVTASQNPTTPASTAPPPSNLPQEYEKSGADEISPNERSHLTTSVQGPPPPTTAPEKQNRIQITDLHTLNPLVSYNSQLYSCDWTTTLGTDMLFVATVPESAEPETSPPSQSPRPAPAPPQPCASLLATTRIKLSAHPVHVLPRPESVSLTAISEVAATSTGTATAPISSSSTVEEPLIALPPNAKPHRQNQAAFLTRLINIKRAKDETDEVNVHRGSRDVQRGVGGAGEVADIGEEDWEREEGADSLWMPGGSPVKVGRGNRRGRSRGRTGTRARRVRKEPGGAGLFQGHQPSGSSGEMGTAQQTPERWVHLARPGGDYERGVPGGEGHDSREHLGGNGTVDWRQRHSEHLGSNESPVVHPAGDIGYGPSAAGEAGDREGEDTGDVEMEDA